MKSEKQIREFIETINQKEKVYGKNEKEQIAKKILEWVLEERVKEGFISA